MATCNPSELLAAHPCFCGATVNPLKLARLSLLCQILQTLDPMASCNVDDLLERGKCFCPVTVNPADIAELQLLCDIAAAASGGGGGGEAGVGSPEGVVTADPGVTYLDTSNGFFYAKQTGVGNTGWLAIVT
jgi:hypothetical protein